MAGRDRSIGEGLATLGTWGRQAFGRREIVSRAVRLLECLPLFSVGRTVYI